jgi:hypothetical protein
MKSLRLKEESENSRKWNKGEELVQEDNLLLKDRCSAIINVTKGSVAQLRSEVEKLEEYFDEFEDVCFEKLLTDEDLTREEYARAKVAAEEINLQLQSLGRSARSAYSRFTEKYEYFLNAKDSEY